MLVLFAAVAAAPAGSATQEKVRPVGVRIAWLEQRVSYHQFVCRNGDNYPKWWHCKALVWTKRELGEARAEQSHLLRTGDWQVATVLADRVFPGTRSWLLSCSSGEGGHGRFVYNHQGSGAGGWMQFMSSTYYGHVGAARAEVARLGYRVDTSAWSYYHPLGQALTAAYMRSHGMSSHWDPGIDPLCR